MESDAIVWLILVSASRPFLLAALQELRLDSAAAVSGGQPMSGWRRGLMILLRLGRCCANGVGVSRNAFRTF